jgi:hypothetical protein
MHRQINLFILFVAACCCLTAFSGIQAADNIPSNNTLAGPPPAMTNEQVIRRALIEPTSLDFQGASLTDVMNYIAENQHIQFLFDNNALKEAGIDPTTTLVTFSIKNITLRSALNFILTPHGLTSMIKDEVLLITTKAKADSIFETRLYDVRDLVVHDDEPGAPPDFDSLVDAIRLTVNPQSWDKAGGQGSVAAFSNNGVCALIVWQNDQGHEQLEQLLNKLRSLEPTRLSINENGR